MFSSVLSKVAARFIRDQRGATMLEYGLLVGLVAIAAIIAVTAMGGALSGLASWPLVVTLLILCLVVTFLTEVTSNTATATLLMPVLAAAAVGADIEPALLMAPAALSASLPPAAP